MKTGYTYFNVPYLLSRSAIRYALINSIRPRKVYKMNKLIDEIYTWF